MTDATDGAALLRSILLYPDDLLARRIWADYLDDTDDPARAAFVRAMLDSRQADAPRDWIANRRKGLDLLYQHSHWLTGSPLPVPSAASFFDTQGSIQAAFGPLTSWWANGLCWCLRGDILPVLQYAPAIFARHPVREVLLADIDGACLEEHQVGYDDDGRTRILFGSSIGTYAYRWRPVLLHDHFVDALERADRLHGWCALCDAAVPVTRTYYTSRAAANAALSSVVVGFFRDRAGLPPLP